MSTLTKCDVYRDGVHATMNAAACTGSSPPAECCIMDLANKHDMYIQTKYKPSGFISQIARDVRNKKLSLIQKDIDNDITQIQAKYGHDVPTNFTWNGLTKCLWNSDGSAGGTHHNKYFKRNDLTTLGYQPQPIFSALNGKLPLVFTEKIPIWMDHVFNPDLAVVIIFAFLIIIFAAIVYTAYEWYKKEPMRQIANKEAHRIKMEAHDPYKGSPFESYPADPDSKWKELVPVYEAQGYCMEAYRKKLGMPITDHC